MAANPSGRTPLRKFLTVSNQLTAWGTIWFSLGFIAVIWMQTDHARSLLYDAERRHRAQLTELAATRLYEPLRLREVPAVRQAFRSITAEEQSDLLAAAALDRDGNILATYQQDADRPFSLGGTLRNGNLERRAAGLQTGIVDGRLVIASPVLSQDGGKPAGTLLAAWSLAVTDRTTKSMFMRTSTFGLLLIGAFVTLSLAVVHLYFSDPLKQVTDATTRIANGNKHFDIPCTDRRDEVGDMARALVTFRTNVSLIDRLTAEQQQQAQRLANALEKEREYNALHREFVSMVSHEFRTPVAIIDGAAQRIERRAGKDSPDQLRDRTGKIRSAVARMIELIDSTLSVTRLEAGSIELEPVPCDFAALLQDVCQRQRDLARQHSISLTIADMPRQILIDAKRMDQVFTNLLSNAVKYAPDAPNIEVKAGIIGDEIVVSVRDHGLGIPEAEQTKVFERFFRASTSTGVPGTGIGLHLVKYLVELHEGSVAIDSREGGGTTVSVSFPVKLAEDGPATEEGHPTAAALA